MIVKAAPRLATILWLGKALVGVWSRTGGECIPLVRELHWGSVMESCRFEQRITYVGNANGRSRVGHGGRYCVCGNCWMARTSDRRQVSSAKSDAAFGNDGRFRRCNSGYNAGKSKRPRVDCLEAGPLVSFPVLRKPPSPGPCSPAEPFCGEAAEASDKPTFAARSQKKCWKLRPRH